MHPYFVDMLAASSSEERPSPPTPALTSSSAFRDHRPRTTTSRANRVSVPVGSFLTRNKPYLTTEIYLFPVTTKPIWMRLGGSGHPFRVRIPEMTLGDLKTRLADGRRGVYTRLELKTWYISSRLREGGRWSHLGEMRDDEKMIIERYLPGRWEYEIVVHGL